MFYGPVAHKFADADPSALARAKNHSDYKFHSVLLGKPWVLRWSQGAHLKQGNILFDDTLPDALLALAKEREKHLGQLATLGIIIPEHQSFIGISPYEPAATVLYDRVRFVEGTEVSDIDRPEVLRRLGSMLDAYLELRKASDDKRYLHDVFAPNQYILTADGGLSLVDLEPLLHTLDDTSNSRAHIEDNIRPYLDNYAIGEHW